MLWDFWLKPLEIPFGGDKLADILKQFITQIVRSQGTGRHKGDFEKFTRKMEAHIDIRALLLYAQFVSHTETQKGDVEGILKALTKFSE